MNELNFADFPPIDTRRETFKKVVELCNKPPTIVEIGMSRKPDLGDGNSINVWAWLLQKCKGSYYGFDISEEATEYSTKAIEKWNIPDDCNIAIYCMDAVSGLRGYDGPAIDILYLDGWDWDAPRDPDSVIFHIACMYEALPHMAPNGLVLIDDIMDATTYQGKGEVVIPYLLGLGWKVLDSGYQFLLTKGE